MKELVVLFFIFISIAAFTQEEIPYTLEDREKLIKIEERLNSLNERINSTNERITSLEKQMNVKFEGVDTKFESQQQQINDLKQFFFWGFGIVIALIIALFGYIMWDRRTALYPLLNRVNSLEHHQDEFGRKLVEVNKIKTALKEMGESDSKIAEILKRVAIF